ncbi:hypothetical protein [Bacillus sp. NEB1478]|uniref:hypothetical protein n=1 Tax=Bacillus sp. NEB1478 TaxID=3073816 RepID=UPI002873446F|nr:hypothetical protein [Bacillus sp. NEB1478]WNB93435.1 hypothetical protein RGB74_07125 [Bacillus sp. NEB1478]
MSSDFKCIVCKGTHFRKGYYEIDVDVSIYPSASNDVDVTKRSYDCDCDFDVDVRTTIYNEIDSSGEVGFRLISEDESKYGSRFDDCSDIFKYICEDCGYIMSFAKEKNVESYHQEKNRKQKENTYDWSGFGKNN